MSDSGFGAPSSLSQRPAGRARNLHSAAGVAALVIGYAGAAELSLLLAIPPGFATAVWPPSGIALAALLLFGPRFWPGIWLGAFLANMSAAMPWPWVALIATGNTLEAAAACWLIH